MNDNSPKLQPETERIFKFFEAGKSNRWIHEHGGVNKVELSSFRDRWNSLKCADIDWSEQEQRAAA